MRTASFLALAVALSLAGAGPSGAQPKAQPKTPQQIYAQFRATMSEGKYDIAGIYLEEFLKSNPTDADFLEIEKKHGTTAFQQLRAVPKYSDDPTTEKKIRADIEELNKRANAALGKVLYNKERVSKYISNLGATYEEKVFAQQELKRTGEFAVPYMVEALRQNPGPELYAGILDTIPVMEGPTMAGWVAALDGLTVDRQYGVIQALAARRDVLNLLEYAQTDFTPHLWHILAQDPKTTPQNLRDLALKLLTRFRPGAKADTRRPEVELVEAARRFYEHKARYLGPKVNPGGTPPTVPLWTATVTDGVLSLARLPDVPVGQADEYYGLRYARWALQSKPEYEPAQSLILALAAERAVERAKFGHLATAEPAVYKLLAEAPSRTLNDLLVRGLAEKRTPLVLATVQVLGDRADRAATTPPAGAVPRPSLMVRALDYPDPAVQFAAATALLRSPVPVPADAKPKIVDILRRASAADPFTAPESKGRVLLADPNKLRAEANSRLLRSFGFTVEHYTTGRDLLRRIAKASDFDLLFIDHHAAPPELIDLISQLDASPRTAARPTFVVASSEKPRVPTFDQLLLRMAVMIAATENDIISMPVPYVPDLKYTPEERSEQRRQVQERRDATFRSAVAARTARLRRVIDTLPLTLTEQQDRVMDLRIQLIEHAILAIEFPLTPESAPATAAELVRIRKQLALQPPSPAYGVGVASADLMKLIDRFELDVAKVKAAQDKYDFLRMHVDPVALGLPVETFRDEVLEARLGRLLKNYPGVRIISEPYSRMALETELKATFADPMKNPRDPAVKKAEAKTAVGYFRLMAIGDLPGYDLRSAEGELRDALNSTDPEVVSAAIDAVERYKSGAAQLALAQVALKDVRDRPLANRKKAADALIRHIRAYGKALPAARVAEIAKQSNVNDPQGEKDAELRGKFLTLKGMLDFKPGPFVDQLKGYSPPIIPPEPKKEPDSKKEPDKKEPEPKP